MRRRQLVRSLLALVGGHLPACARDPTSVEIVSKKKNAPPPALTKVAAARWLAIIPELAARGPVDRDRLATYCQVWARWKEAEAGIARTGQLVRNAKGRPVPSPLIAISNQAAQQLRALERQLGISAEATDVEDTAPADAGALLTRRDLASRLAVNMMTVTKWEQQGLPIAIRGRKGKPSKYRETDARAWLQMREDAAKQTGGVNLVQDRARRERAQAALAEQAFQIRMRDLLPREEVERLWAAEITAVRTKLLALPTGAADRIHRAAVTDGLPGVERALEDAVHAVLIELADPNRPIPSPSPPNGQGIAAVA